MDTILTRDQIRRVDAIAMDEYGIPGPVLMENAGRNAAEIINRHYGPDGSAFICCGPGNNGGDGCVIARHLHNAGWKVSILLAGKADRLSDDMALNFGICMAMKLPIRVEPGWAGQREAVKSIDSECVFIDALLGTGFKGEVRSPTCDLIASLNESSSRATVCVDIPSGLNCDTGEQSNATVRGDLTITFVAKKTGLVADCAASHVGQVEVADIGVPRELVARVLEQQ